MKAGLEALWYGLENNDVGNMDSAITALATAQEGMSGLLGQIGGQINNLDLQKTRHENNKIFIQERADNIEKVDISEALTQFSQEQATLQASMMVISRVNSLSLLDFLR